MHQDNDLTKMIKDLRTSQDYEVRINAARSLAITKDPRVLEPLLDALTDSDEDVRAEVAKSIAAVGDKSVTGRLVSILTDSDPKVRIEVVKALHQLDAFEAIPDIYLRLHDPDWGVRNWAVRILHNFIDSIITCETKQGIDLILELLKTDEPTLRRKVEESLIGCGVTYFQQYQDILDHGNAQQKKSICHILGKIGDERAVFPLINIIKDWDKDVRRAVIRALGDLKDQRAINPLIRTLGDANADVRQETIKSLTRFGDPAVLPLIRAVIMSRDSYIRQNAALALGEIGDKRAISALLVALSDSYFLVRNAAELALTKFGPGIADRLVRILTLPVVDSELANQLIDSPLANERLKGVELLGRMQDPRAVKVLQRLLQDPYPKVQEEAQKVLFSLGCYAWARTGAARLLGTLRARQTAATVMAALDDPDKDVRIEAIRAIGFFRDPDVVPRLIPKLSDSNPETRQVTAWSLGRIGQAQALPALLENLNDTNSESRTATIVALGKLLDSRAVLPLLKLMGSSSYRQKETISNAIKTIGRRAIPVILKVLGEGDKEIQAAVEDILNFMKDDLTEEIIQDILPNLTTEQKEYFLTVMGRK